MGKHQDRSSTPPADGPPPLSGHNGVEPHAPWSTQATPTTAGMPSPSGRGADPGTAAHLVGAAGYLADPRPPPGSLLNGGAGEHRPAPWQRVHDLPRDKLDRLLVGLAANCRHSLLLDAPFFAFNMMSPPPSPLFLLGGRPYLSVECSS